jgi:hypothetical protein
MILDDEGLPPSGSVQCSTVACGRDSACWSEENTCHVGTFTDGPEVSVTLQ